MFFNETKILAMLDMKPVMDCKFGLVSNNLGCMKSKMECSCNAMSHRLGECQFMVPLINFLASWILG